MKDYHRNGVTFWESDYVTVHHSSTVASGDVSRPLLSDVEAFTLGQFGEPNQHCISVDLPCNVTDQTQRNMRIQVNLHIDCVVNLIELLIST